MKKILLSIACTMIFGIAAYAQSPNLMNYQGVARNASGAPLANTNISLRLTIHDGGATGSTVYQETQSVTTNAFGLYNVAVGNGTATSGTFAGINWSSGSKWMQVEIDPSGGSSYTSLGASQLLSVPFALYAAAGPSGGSGGVSSVTAGSGLSGGTITSTGTISMPNVGTAGTYGSSTQVPVITTDAQGRVSNVTLAAISGSGGGTVTSVNTSSPLTGGPITSTGTIGLANSGVTAGTYGSATQSPVLTIDAYGRVTSATTAAISGGGGVTSTGTTNYIPKFTSSTAVGNSGMYQNGSKVGLGTTTPISTFEATSTTDTMAGFFNTTYGTTAPNYGVLRTEYGATTDGGYAMVGAGINAITNNHTIGVLGGGTSIGTYGVGESSTTSGTSQVTGVQGESYTDGFLSIGVGGYAYNYTGTPSYCIGVYGDELDAISAGTAGISNYAGYFDGDVFINGTMSASSKSFKIDDPIDPDNKYLFHSCVESNEMMNIYSGNITTDGSGVATVTLPSYFEALNKDFRYQLTVIGSFAQAIISQEIADNKFEIKTNVPNVKVSWQVTAVRHDAYANAHPIIAEQEKEPFNKGKYLNAKELGKSESQQIGHFKRNMDQSNAAKKALQPIGKK